MSVTGPIPDPTAHEPQKPGTSSGERSVIIHGPNNAPVTTGDHSPVHLTTVDTRSLPPVTEVPTTAGPVGVTGHIPLFVGRSEELTDLERALARGPGAVVQAVHGLGGIGKSALAARYVRLHAWQYTQVVWIDAEDAAGTEAGLRRFAVALEPQLAVLPSEALAERATAWLAAHDGWLLVLDNVNTLGDISALLDRLGAGTGRFLATSRKAIGWSRIGATAVRLGVLEPEEALALLAATIGTTPDTLDCGAQLCAELGFLPLAITQAGAYIAQNQHQDTPSARGYLRLLAERPAHLYATGDEDTDSERTIARIWHITLDRLTDTQLAGQTLRVLAWYAPDAIPTSLLGPLTSQPELDQALGKLAAYNMLTRTPADPADPQTGPRLAVHRLVQAVTRTPDPHDPHRVPAAIVQARGQATELLKTALPGHPEDSGTWTAWRRLIPHIDALADHTTPDTDTAATAHILGQAGGFLANQGLPARAIRHHQRALTNYERVLGPDHPDTLGSRNNLANAYALVGDLGRAIPLHEQILTDSERVLGEDHPRTLTSRNNLALAYKSAGDLGRAIPLYERILSDSERVLGPDHPDTLGSRNNLANAYALVGDLGRAIPLHEQILTDSERVLGEDHPRTLGSRNNLALAYKSAGDLGRAIPLCKRILSDSERVLGPDHPDTLGSRNNLANAYWSASRVDEAIPLYERTLTDRTRVLGEDHPHTLTSRNNLALAYKSAGDLGRAIPLYEQILTDSKRVLGEDHPLTETVRGNLAGAIAQRDGSRSP